MTSLLVCVHDGKGSLQNYEMTLPSVRVTTLELYRAVEDMLTAEGHGGTCVCKVLIYDDHSRSWELVMLTSGGMASSYAPFSQLLAVRSSENEAGRVIPPPVATIPAPKPATQYNKIRAENRTRYVPANPILTGDKRAALWAFFRSKGSKSGSGVDRMGFTIAMNALGATAPLSTMELVYSQYATAVGAYWTDRDFDRFLEHFPLTSDAMHKSAVLLHSSEELTNALSETHVLMGAKSTQTTTLLKLQYETEISVHTLECREQDLLDQIKEITDSPFRAQQQMMIDAEVRLNLQRGRVFQQENEMYATAERFDAFAVKALSPIRSVRDIRALY